MRVITLTSDKYLHVLRPYSYLFNKYWGADQPVLVAGFTPPSFDLPPNFTFHSIGKFEDYPASRWSDAVIKLLNEIDDESFCLMLEDYFLTRPVDRRAVHMLNDYARQFGYVLRIDLSTDRLFMNGPQYHKDIPDYGYCGYIDLIKSEPGNQYQMSLQAGIWRRDNLLKVLIPGESPWQVELDGTGRVNANRDLLVLGTRQWPIRYTIGCKGGNPSEMSFSGVDFNDILTMRELNHIP